MNPRIAEELWFETTDGVRLFYRYWPGAGVNGILLLHRGHEHSGRLQHIVDEVNLPNHAIFAWDARGHGRSPGERGDSPSLARSIRDLDDFARHVATTHGIAFENLAVLAQSLASVIATAWVHDYAPKIRAMVLVAPAFSVNLYVPFARFGLSLLLALRGNFFVQSYVKAKLLTHDPARIASYESDPLITRAISVRVLLGLYDTADRIVSDAAAIQTPTQVLVSGQDWVVRSGPQHEFFNNLGARTKELHTFPEFFHDTLGEKDRAQALTKVRIFLNRVFAAPPDHPSLLSADKRGFTKAEFDAFSEPKPLRFAGTKWSMRSGGRLSDGIRLGLRTGFDSGASLDYVYRNQPSGITPIGKIIDFGYLNAIGWRGIRIRKTHIEKLLARIGAERPLNLLDIAAGHGRYVLDALPANASALLRDFDPANVEAGRALIESRGLAHRVRFEQADAFNPAAYEGLRHNAAIISGLFELFPDNDPVRKALAGVAAAVEPGGYLLYTGQPWHPQLEMIARTLPSHRGGGAWVMRRRTQAELDQLVESAGFTKVDQLIDDFGIFTVGLAKRNPA
jgi:alpha-beta hydrolase superfamily lysophospholipase